MTARPVVEHRWRAMGAAAHVVVVEGDARAIPGAVDRVDSLERRWSRFLPQSELCRINAAAGAPVLVSADTVDLVARTLAATETTGGLFDARILPALRTAGYDRSYEFVRGHPVDADAPCLVAAPHHAGAPILVDRVIGSVQVAPGTEIDLGGIGKGRAADIVAEELFARGASGVMVNLGGDLRAIGSAPTNHGWIVEIDPVFEEPLGRIALREGAVATSSQRTRRWTVAGESRHHLIDPRTGRPAVSDLAAVTVISGEAERAEVLAKAALIAGGSDGASLLRDHDVPALFVYVDGSTEALGGFEHFLLRPALRPAA